MTHRSRRPLPALALFGVAALTVTYTDTTNLFTIDLRDTPACPTPAAPVLTSPANGGSVSLTAGAVPLTWQVPKDARTFDVYLDTANPPARVVASDVPTVAPDPSNVPAGTTQSYSVSNLLPSQTYRWKVVAKGSASCTPQTATSSAVSSFLTQGVCAQPGDFALTAPSNGSTQSGDVTLDWGDAEGAGSYDVYLGPVNPPGLYRSKVTGSSLKVSGLVAGTTYHWFVIARAACDETRTRETAVASFRMSGACAAPGPVVVSSPQPGATGVSTRPVLSWQAASNAASYDVYLGPSSTPSLWAAFVIGTQLQVTGLTPGVNYYWKVVARPGCDGVKATETPVVPFTVTPDCQAPPAPGFTYWPGTKVGIGQSYPVAWTNVGLGEGGGYLVQRSTSSSFPSTGLESQVASGTSALFLAAEAKTYYHRVQALAGCDASVRSAWSDVKPVEADTGKSNVVFSKPPAAVVTALGSGLDEAVNQADPSGASRTVTIENISGKPITAFVSGNPIGGSPAFFSVEDPLGAPIYPGIPLGVGETKQLRVKFTSVPADRPGVYEGVIYANTTDQEVIPISFVNLKVSGGQAAAPQFLVNGVPAEYVFFPGWKGTDDTARPPVTVTVKNPGKTTPMELGAEISPELWLEPKAQWNKDAIPADGSIDVPLYTKRGRALDGSALPRYTYLTVRTKEGKTARLLVQDNDVAESGKVPRTFLDSTTPSFVVPSVVTSATFVSRLSLTNTGTEDVTTQLIFTPSSASQDVDGFDETRIRKVTVIVPKRDVVAMTDPLKQVFGLDPGSYGQLEVRVAPERIGFLAVASGVDAAGEAGGSYGFKLPTLGRGEGAREGEPHVITNVVSNDSFRTNLILVETSGLGKNGSEPNIVSVTLYDRDGKTVGRKGTYYLPRYGHVQVSRLVEAFGGSNLDGVSLELKVESGGGTVAGVLTVIDNRTLDASTYRSRPATVAPTGARALALLGRSQPRWAALAAADRATLVVPAVVNGYATFKDQPDAPYTFKSLLSLTSTNGQPASFRLEYHELETGRVVVETRTVPARGTLQFRNVLEELFGVPAGGKSNGPVFVEADLNGIVTCRVYSELASGSLGDSFPIVPLTASYLTGGGSARRIVQVDGLEQSLDGTRGTRSNLILNEIVGKSVKVAVRLYEAGNRSRPIAERVIDLAPLQKLQLSTVFRDLGLDEEGVKHKERTNVLCQVEGLEGEGLAVATVTTIDNRTGDTRNGVLEPPGAGDGIGIGR